MTDAFNIILIILIGSFTGGVIAGFVIIQIVKRNFFKPKLYFKNIQILPGKGDIEGDHFTWGGLVFTGELHNDSDYWAYNVRIDDIYAEFLPNTTIKIVHRIPLRLATDLPRTENLIYFQSNSQLVNIKPGEHISTSIRILTKKSVSLNDYKQLIKELRMIQIKTKLIYENSAGFPSNTLFWLDFQHTRFINFFGRKHTDNQIWKRSKPDAKTSIKIKSKIIEIETEPF